MFIRKCNLSDKDAIFNDYIENFNEGEILSKWFLNAYWDPSKTLVLTQNKKIASSLQYKIYNSKGENNKNYKILFIFCVYTNFNYRKQGYAKKLIKYLIENNENFFDDIWLQTFLPKVYASSGFQPIIYRFIGKLKPNAINDFKNAKNNSFVIKDDLSNDKLLNIYKKWCENQKIFLIRHENYYKNIRTYPTDKNVVIYSINNSYVIVNNKTKYVLELISNNKKELLFLLNLFKNYLFYIINQPDISDFFIIKKKIPLVFAYKKNKIFNELMFNDVLFLD